MLFDKILVALDGSQNSRNAAEYAFWLSSNLDAEITGQHVIDPRLVDLFISPEFAEELGFSCSVDTSEKVFSALKKVGKVILDLFVREASERGMQVATCLDEGYIVECILSRLKEHDLLIMGHKSREDSEMPLNIVLGSVAERLAVNSKKSVLIASRPLKEIEQILVAYDGSEPSRGALLMAENLAKNTNCKLKAITVVPPGSDLHSTKVLAQDGEKYLREFWPENVFYHKEGVVAESLLNQAKTSNSLLVIGAYGYNNKEQNVLGSTTTEVLRKAVASTLVFKPIGKRSSKKKTMGAQPAQVT
ncbi:MAG: universal stress protein [Candidatus Melainabacteria bacterium]|nr:universal stress protein [Candidatus Melainabacteria bacterium]